MNIEEWLRTILSHTIKETLFYVSGSEKNTDNNSVIEFQILVNDAPFYRIKLDSAGEGLILLSGTLEKYDHEGVINTFTTREITHFDSSAIKGKLIEAASTFKSTRAIIGFELSLDNGEKFQVFNNGDEFAFALNRDLPPALEHGVTKIAVE